MTDRGLPTSSARLSGGHDNGSAIEPPQISVECSTPQTMVDGEATLSENDMDIIAESDLPDYDTYSRSFFDISISGDQDKAIVSDQPTETSPLLKSIDSRRVAVTADSSSEDYIEAQLDEIGAPGVINVTWLHETKIILSYAAPLIGTSLLQCSVDISSILAVGRLGQLELGAVTLANMSAAITCFAVFQGLATGLDTLCPQAYGSRQKHLVGIYCQRMTFFLLCLFVPISTMWIYSEHILLYLVPDPETARLTSLYLKVLVFAIPGFITFETGKRFLQAQGLFSATTSVFLIAAPFNVMLTWLLVWKLRMGFIGAPISVAITRTLLPMLLALYVKFFDGSQCWGGFSRISFTNWWPMVRLAVPGMIMVIAEWLAFEIITILSSRFGTEYLAAQGILAVAESISYQFFSPVSIAASTRVAHLIGAGRVDDAKMASKVAFVMSSFISILILLLYLALKVYIPFIFTDDKAVSSLATLALPFVGIAASFDGVCLMAHGLLRGIGRQSIGGPVNIIAFYFIALPISLTLAVKLDWKLQGLWIGPVIALVIVSIIEYTYLLVTNWHKAAMEAVSRTAAG